MKGVLLCLFLVLWFLLAQWPLVHGELLTHWAWKILFQTHPRSSQQGKHNKICRKQTRWHKEGLDVCPWLTAAPDGHLTALQPLCKQDPGQPCTFFFQNWNNLLILISSKGLAVFGVQPTLLCQLWKGYQDLCLPKPVVPVLLHHQHPQPWVGSSPVFSDALKM